MNSEMFERRKKALELQIEDTQKSIAELANQITKFGTNKITANGLNYITPNLVQLQYKLATLEVELSTLNSYEYYQ